MTTLEELRVRSNQVWNNYIQALSRRDAEAIAKYWKEYEQIRDEFKKIREP